MSSTQPTLVQVVFRNMDPSEAVEAKVREKAEKLQTFYSPIMGCRVAIEARHHHHHQGNLYQVRVDVTVPGHELVADRQPQDNHAYTDVYVVIRDAFDAMRRQLEDLKRHLEGKVKAHVPVGHGRLVEIAADRQSGRIETTDGRSLYMHRNSLVEGDFDQVSPGAEVRFDEEQGEEGPQASTVHLIGKHHIPG